MCTHVVTKVRRFYPSTMIVLVVSLLAVKFQDITTEAFSHPTPSARLSHHHPFATCISDSQMIRKQLIVTRRMESEMFKLNLAKSHTDGNDSEDQATLHQRVSTIISKFSLLAPAWTSLAALYAIYNPSSATIFGSPNVMQNALLTLMFAMGIAILPKDVSRAISNPKILMMNAILCFGMVPLLGLGLSQVLRVVAGVTNTYTLSTHVGLLLLASVSGGQASNLFTLIAGGDVALSVICTLSTTLLGVLATPLLTKLLLGQTVEVKLIPVVKSVASLVLLPLMTGLGLGKWLPTRVHQETIVPFTPVVGILATLILVAGGASSLSSNQALAGPRQWLAMALPSSLLCILSGAAALQLINVQNRRKPQDQIDEAAKRALVIETLSKSPTLAYFLASRHFGTKAAAVPAAAMVTLAVLGALVASLWSALAPAVDTD